MKKLFALLLTLTLFFGISGTTFAAEGDTLSLAVDPDSSVYGANYRFTSTFTTYETIAFTTNINYYANEIYEGSSYVYKYASETVPTVLTNYKYVQLNPGTYEIYAAIPGAGTSFSYISNKVTITVPAPKFAVNVSANPTEGGSVSGDGNYTEGSSVTFLLKTTHTY